MPAVIFRSYSHYLKQKYGEPVYRVSVDAGFSCPNRGKDRRAQGCLYCDERGSRAPYLGTDKVQSSNWQRSLRAQIDDARKFLEHRYAARKYILYFQAFSSTYAPVQRLKEIYDYGLDCAEFEELVVSTRPDCIDERKADLLASYRERELDVWIELGLQSASDASLRRIERGHTVADFDRSYRLCKEREIKVAVHVIFGLPGEGLTEILNTVRYLATLQPDGIKIHNLHIPRGCPLFTEYLAGELTVPNDERHLEYTIRALELLPPETVIMRLTCDTPQQLLGAPLHFRPKPAYLSALRRALGTRGTWQGRLYQGSPARC